MRLVEIEEQREVEAISAVIGPGSKEEAAVRLRAGCYIGDAASRSKRLKRPGPSASSISTSLRSIAEHSGKS